MADSSALFALGVRDPIVLGGLPVDVGLRVLARWTGTEASALPLAATELAEAIGFHAQGLRILGAVVASASDPEAEWLYLQQQLRTRSVTAEALPGIPEANLASLVDQVVDVLRDDERTVVDVLAVLPAATVLDLPSLARMACMDEDPFRRLADSLARRSLVVTSCGRYGLSAIVQLRTRERRGFDNRYRQVVERLSPPRPALILSIVMRDVPMALRLVASSSAESLAQSTKEFGSPVHQAAVPRLDRGARSDARAWRGCWRRRPRRIRPAAVRRSRWADRRRKTADEARRFAIAPRQGARRCLDRAVSQADAHSGRVA